MAFTSLIVIALLTAANAGAQIRFEDVSQETMTNYKGESYGASWGDSNGDGWPDLFVNHHRARPSLFINQGDGNFEDRWFEVDRWRTEPWADQHGASWADFDNDGDQDLIVSAGFGTTLQFLVNNGEILTDKTADYGFSTYNVGGRLPVWVDFTGDGSLDWGLAILRSPPALFGQVPEQPTALTFTRMNAATGQKCSQLQYLQLADLNADGDLDLICPGQDIFPDKVYSMGTPSFTDITAIVPTVTQAVDSFVGDFDGNLQTDLFVVRGFQRPSGAELTGQNNDGIEASVVSGNANENGFTFSTQGDIRITISWNNGSPAKVFVGSEGYRLAVQDNGMLVANLSPADPSNIGLMPHDPALNQGVYIGYDPESQVWKVMVSPGSKWNYAYFFVNSTTTIADLNFIGLQVGDRPITPAFFFNEGGVLTNRTSAAGFGPPISCVSGAAGDFDNDMDLDLYLVCRGAISNLSNRLYENHGDGTFRLLSEITGAEGPVGRGVGLGENVVVADYDVDGFLDLFVTNGLALYPEVKFVNNGGTDNMFRNLGNANHWVQVDLVGTTANRDAVGARVYATAGSSESGIVTQFREQNGGYHRWAQNHQRIHFGLGANETVDIEVHWPKPSNRVDMFTGLPADRLYRITEGGLVEEITPAATVPPSPCTKPIYNKATESAVFLWKDCNAGTWQVRASPGGRSLTHQGSVIATQAFDSVTGVSIESNDVLDVSTDPSRIDYTLQVSGQEDGFDFRLPSSGTACFTSTLPADSPVYLGYARTPLYPPFDLNTFGPCTNLPPQISVADITAQENEPTGMAAVTVSLSKASTAPVTVSVSSADGTAKAPNDYTAVPSTVLTFAPGETSQQVSVAIHDDALAEGPEDFLIVLSNPVNATLATTTAKVTITDNEPSPCGAPTYASATERGIFLWKNCSDGRWRARMTTGTSKVTHRGALLADQPFVNPTGFSIETVDTLDVTSDPNRITYQMTGSAGSQDGVDFSVTEGASVCFTVAAPAGVPIYVGAARTLVQAPFDLATLGTCGAVLPPTLSIADMAVVESDPSGTAELMLSLSKAMPTEVSVDVATANGTAIAPADYTEVAVTTVTFSAGEISRSLVVGINDDNLAEGDETFTVALSNPVNADLNMTEATVTITDDEASPCGQPTYSPTTDRAVFVWKNCTSGAWSARMTAGGSSIIYQGIVSSDLGFLNVTGFNIEAVDTLDFTTDPNRISYLMRGGSGSQDGVNFSAPAGADLCFAVDAPTEIPVYLGAARTLMPASFNLLTLESCAISP